MTTQTIITIDQICEHFHIETSIILDFIDFGLFPAISHDGETGIEAQNLDRLAEIISLHEALGINKEGIEVILNQREQIARLNDEIDRLQRAVKSLEYHLESENIETLRRRGLLIDIEN